MSREMTKGARFSFFAMLYCLGTVFWIATRTGHFEMSALVYGARVLEYPSEWWAIGMLVPSSVYLLALVINGRCWWTAYLRIACAFLLSSYFSYFVFSAWPAAGGDLMVIASGVLGTKAACMAYFDAVELVQRWRQPHDRARV